MPDEQQNQNQQGRQNEQNKERRPDQERKQGESGDTAGEHGKMAPGSAKGLDTEREEE